MAQCRDGEKVPRELKPHLFSRSITQTDAVVPAICTEQTIDENFETEREKIYYVIRNADSKGSLLRPFAVWRTSLFLDVVSRDVRVVGLDMRENLMWSVFGEAQWLDRVWAILDQFWVNLSQLCVRLAPYYLCMLYNAQILYLPHGI